MRAPAGFNAKPLPMSLKPPAPPSRPPRLPGLVITVGARALTLRSVIGRLELAHSRPGLPPELANGGLSSFTQVPPDLRVIEAGGRRFDRALLGIADVLDLFADGLTLDDPIGTRGAWRGTVREWFEEVNTATGGIAKGGEDPTAALAAALAEAVARAKPGPGQAASHPKPAAPPAAPGPPRTKPLRKRGRQQDPGRDRVYPLAVEILTEFKHRRRPWTVEAFGGELAARLNAEGFFFSIFKGDTNILMTEINTEYVRAKEEVFGSGNSDP
jgi:hypothetical protein